jgi:hypothetical protein
MQVYALPSSASVSSVVLDTLMPDSPPPPPTPPPTGVRAWVEGASYTVGQPVVHRDATYVCLQAHTVWQGIGWTPDASPSL